MKALNKILLLAFIATLFISCGDDEPETIPFQVTEEYVYTWDIRGSEGISGSYELGAINLADIIGKDAANRFKKGEMQIADSYMEITGLKAMNPSPVLMDFSLFLEKGPSVNFGNCTANASSLTDFASDVKQSTKPVSNFLQSVFAAYTSKNKTAKMTISFKPTHDIKASHNVKIKLVFTGTYHYVVEK